ncbi:MAG: calcium-translocating P-type ATPase, PMCA-type [Clostridiaceae bacterium]|nr:calcium-translocating P-type ATPase, PMCA-type [Clostridiaceae bacterium]
MNYCLSQVDDVLQELKTSKDGLTSQEAGKRLEQNGKNKLAEAKKDSLLKRFFDQMKDPMIIILLVAAAVSAVTDIIEKGHMVVPTDSLIILFVVIVNAVLGVVQESKAEKAIEALQEMSAATTKTLRDGKVVSVRSEDLVVGDVIILDAGDAIPADCRIIECASMKIEEAALTGESVPVTKLVKALMQNGDKDIPLGDRKNMAYMGSTLVYGRGKAVVTATGMDTEMGKIASAISLAEEGKTPLELKLEQLSKVLTKIVIGVCIFIFAFDLITKFFLVADKPPFIDVALSSFITAIALAVAAIPEGLVAVMTIVLAIGVTNMSKKNAIIRKMTAVETLGCTQIICSDKTGTLTQNVMTVVDHYADDEKTLATAMALCTNAEVEADGKSTGEPDEVALINYAKTLGLEKSELVKSEPRTGEVPFDSGRKMMSTVHKKDGQFVQYTKGAPDEILKKCSYYLENGSKAPLTDSVRKKIMEENTRMGNKALRVFAAAYKTYEKEPDEYSSEKLENEMIFIGLTGMIDPVRPEVKASIEECRNAGITPIMITGDHINTAKAIARELGILSDDSQAMMGSDIDQYSDEEFKDIVQKIRVYARVQPEHKTRIVNAWRSLGYVTAMTGDGVNDAPSIKSADIGVGMGITGTDVTKNVADMVLADDNFATIVSAVGEGRRIYDNIRKAIQFLLGSNLSEVLSVFFASVMNFTILQAPHLLFINLVTDCFPALALGLEKPESDIMRRKPRLKDDGIFAGGLGIDCFYQGILVTLLTVIAFYTGEFLETGKLIFRNIQDSSEGMTMAFFTMSMCEIFHSFNMRSQRGSSVKLVFTGSHNKALYLAMAASLLLTTAVVEIDFLSNLFGFAHLDTKAYLISLFLAFLIIPIVELVKAIQRKTAKK